MEERTIYPAIDKALRLMRIRLKPDDSTHTTEDKSSVYQQLMEKATTTYTLSSTSTGVKALIDDSFVHSTLSQQPTPSNVRLVFDRWACYAAQRQQLRYKLERRLVSEQLQAAETFSSTMKRRCIATFGKMKLAILFHNWKMKSRGFHAIMRSGSRITVNIRPSLSIKQEQYI
jgi:hypothetical protein